MIFQEIKDRNPVFAGRFHTDTQAFVFKQPSFEFENRVVESRKTRLLVGRFNASSSFNDCGNEKRFMEIDTTTGLKSDFHK